VTEVAFDRTVATDLKGTVQTFENDELGRSGALSKGRQRRAEALRKASAAT
jgi:hypothetical protein